MHLAISSSSVIETEAFRPWLGGALELARVFIQFAAKCRRLHLHHTSGISVFLSSDSSASRFIQSLNQPRRLRPKSFLAAMLDASRERAVSNYLDYA
jgi:hypothetical protein